ncbi:MAG: 50S ribosomal protein L3 [Elusimicrobiota bacterium]|jgi:large subunit ribosomal protein L3|nr:50S ribosomal protein L3 [Elusimicrobiota bacterium]
MKSIIGTKVGMTRIFDEKGSLLPITVIKVDKCWATGIKTVEKNGYSALQLGFGIKREKNTTKPYRGIFKNINNAEVPKFLKEFRIDESELVNYALGQEITVDIFEKGDYVDIVGVSKGKGLTGVMKRHNFNGLPSSHGNGEYRRRGGSLSASSYPSRVFKGIKMAGRTGGDNVTLQKLEVVDIKLDDKLILVKGAVPGIKGSYLQLKETSKFLKKKKAEVDSKTELKLNKKR